MRSRSRSADAFEWAGGVRVQQTRIWCDAQRKQELCFVSHAHHPLAWRGGGRARIVASGRTLALAAALGRSVAPGDDAALPTPFCRPFALGRPRLELLPSGHVPGGAQLLVELPGRTVLYAGDVNPRPGRAAEPPQVRAADALCLEAPLAPLTVRAPLPARAAVEAELLAAVSDVLSDGATPVLLVPALGAAGEAALVLTEAGLPVRAHRRIARLLAAYPALGLPLAHPVPAVTARMGPCAVLWPIDARAPPYVRRPRRFLVAGEALDPARVAARRAERGFPLADSGDCADLVAHAAATGAREVWFTAGLTDGVERAFRARGLTCHALSAPAQLALL